MDRPIGNIVFGLEEKIEWMEKRDINWKRKNIIEIKWHVLLFVLREICEKYNKNNII